MSRLSRYEHCYGKAVENPAILAARRQIESVVRERILKYLADAVGIAWVGEGAAEQVFEFAFQAVRIHPRLWHGSAEKQPAEFVHRHRTDVGRIAQALLF